MPFAIARWSPQRLIKHMRKSFIILSTLSTIFITLIWFLASSFLLVCNCWRTETCPCWKCWNDYFVAEIYSANNEIADCVRPSHGTLYVLRLDGFHPNPARRCISERGIFLMLFWQIRTVLRCLPDRYLRHMSFTWGVTLEWARVGLLKEVGLGWRFRSWWVLAGINFCNPIIGSPWTNLVKEHNLCVTRTRRQALSRA